MPLGLVREAADQALGQRLAAAGEVEALLALDQDVVVAIRIELAEGQALEAQALVERAHAPSGAQLADVVHPGAEAVSLEGERVTPAARHVVLLEDQHLLSRVRERERGGEPARSGANHDGIDVNRADHFAGIYHGPVNSKKALWMFVGLLFVGGIVAAAVLGTRGGGGGTRRAARRSRSAGAGADRDGDGRTRPGRHPSTRRGPPLRVAAVPDAAPPDAPAAAVEPPRHPPPPTPGPPPRPTPPPPRRRHRHRRPHRRRRQHRRPPTSSSTSRASSATSTRSRSSTPSRRSSRSSTPVAPGPRRPPR